MEERLKQDCREKQPMSNVQELALKMLDVIMNELTITETANCIMEIRREFELQKQAHVKELAYKLEEDTSYLKRIETLEF